MTPEEIKAWKDRLPPTPEQQRIAALERDLAAAQVRIAALREAAGKAHYIFAAVSVEHSTPQEYELALEAYTGIVSALTALDSAVDEKVVL